MAKITIIDEQDAPLPFPMNNSLAEQSLAILHQLAPGKVAKIRPIGGQTMQGIRDSLDRVAMNNHFTIQQWEVDGFLYVKLA
jgi:hypothetical protein